MSRYKLILAYDGTDYHGWQYQEGLPTVAGVLQETFLQVFDRSISLLATSRTDAGVHALGQVATFNGDPFVDIKRMHWAWNNVLPSSIMIRSLEQVSDSFNLFDAHQKIYTYYFFLERPLPFVARYGWYYHKSISLPLLQEALQLFVGTHDFRCFSTGDERGEDTVRTIDAITLEHLKKFNVYRITVQGKKFLHHMIRRIVGASLDVASGKKGSLSYIKDALARTCRPHDLTNAPACGLVLHKVVYKN